MNVRPTIRDVAQAIGVSHTTVSMALRNDPRILKSTRKRVALEAIRMGYRSDPVVSELMVHLRKSRKCISQNPLAMLTAWPTRNGWRERPHFVQFYKSAQAQAMSLGYVLDEFWLREPGMTARRMTSILRTRNVRGIILQALPEPEGRLDLGWQYFSGVAKGLTVAYPRTHRVVSSHYDDMRLVVRQLAQCGYQRLGLIMDEGESRRVGHAWLAGYYLHQHSVSPEDWVPALFVGGAKAEAQFQQWHGRYRPEVIIFTNLPMREWVSRIGLKVPRDIGLVDLVRTREDTSMTGIDTDPEALGVAAVDLLVGQLQAHEYGIPKRAKIVEVTGQWVPGKTVQKQ